MNADHMHLQRQTMARTAHDHPLLGGALLRHRSTRGQPMSFRLRPFLVELYADLAHGGRVGPRRGSPGGADIVSAPQTGKSDLFVQMALHESGWQGRIFAYVLPVQDSRNGFVARRINPHLLEVPAYRARLPGGDLEDLRAGETGNMKSKRFGSGLMLFLGAKTDGDFVEFSADTMVIDEYDLCWLASRKTDGSTSNLDKAVDRLREGREPRIFRLGNPEIARGGIEALVAAGDQRLWHVRCDRCGERQPVDWETHVVERDDGGRWRLRDREASLNPDVDPRPVCQRCHQPFARSADGAAWIPMSPGAERRSYTISRFDALDQPIRPAWLEWQAAQADSGLLRAWWRGWQGRTWEPASAQITREDVVDAAVLAPNDHVGGASYGGAMTAGIDVGGLLNVVVSRVVRGAGGRPERRAAWVGTCSSFEQAKDILQRFRVRTAVCDARPEIRKAQELRDELREIGIDCWLCEFAESPKADAEEFGMRRDVRSRVVKVDRTQILDKAGDCMRAGAALGRAYRTAGMVPPPLLTGIRAAFVDDVPDGISEIDGVPVVRRALAQAQATEEAERLLMAGIPDPNVDGARLWPADADSVLGLVAQLRAPKRILTPSGRIVWDEGGQPDHFRLADAYDLLAMHLDGRGGSFF